MNNNFDLIGNICNIGNELKNTNKIELSNKLLEQFNKRDKEGLVIMLDNFTELLLKYINEDGTVNIKKLCKNNLSNIESILNNTKIYKN